jgi:multidrug efflux pump subunit AcrB
LDSAKFLLREFGFSVLCGLLASFIPLGNRRASFLYGLTMPLVLGLLIVSVEAPRHLDSAR